MTTENNQQSGGSDLADATCSTLSWHADWDNESEEDNHYWEAASIYHDDGTPFYFRIKQRLREDKHEFYEASDAEVMEDENEPRIWGSLVAAKKGLQATHEEIFASEFL